MANKNVVSNKRSLQTKCSVSLSRFMAPVCPAMGNVSTSKLYAVLECKTVQCSVRKSVKCWNVKGEHRTMSTKSIPGASCVGIFTRCKAQSKARKQDVKALRYAKQGAAIPMKNWSKKKTNSCLPQKTKFSAQRNKCYISSNQKFSNLRQW